MKENNYIKISLIFIIILIFIFCFKKKKNIEGFDGIDCSYVVPNDGGGVGGCRVGPHLSVGAMYIHNTNTEEECRQICNTTDDCVAYEYDTYTTPPVWNLQLPPNRSTGAGALPVSESIVGDGPLDIYQLQEGVCRY